MTQTRYRRGPLSVADRDLLALVAAGHSNRALTRLLGLSLAMVCADLRRIYGRLGATDRGHAVHLGWARGYLTEQTPDQALARARARVGCPGFRDPVTRRRADQPLTASVRCGHCGRAHAADVLGVRAVAS